MPAYVQAELGALWASAGWGAALGALGGAGAGIAIFVLLRARCYEGRFRFARIAAWMILGWIVAVLAFCGGGAGLAAGAHRWVSRELGGGGAIRRVLLGAYASARVDVPALPAPGDPLVDPGLLDRIERGFREGVAGIPVPAGGPQGKALRVAKGGLLRAGERAFAEARGTAGGAPSVEGLAGSASGYAGCAIREALASIFLDAYLFFAILALVALLLPWGMVAMAGRVLPCRKPAQTVK